MRRVRALLAVTLLAGTAPASARAVPRCPLAPTPVTYSAGFSPQAVTIADVTGDGANDLLVTNGESSVDPLSGSLLVYEQHGAGQFGAPHVLPTDQDPNPELSKMDIAVEDFDGDASTDIAVATDRGVNVFRGASADGRRLIETPRASFLAASELTGDGPVDLAVGTTDGIYLARHVAAGEWSVTQISGDVAKDMDAADVTGDGRADVVAAMEEGVVVLARQEDGSFNRSIYPVESLAHDEYVAAGDLTGDGRADVAHGGDHFTLFEQSSDGGLEPRAADESGPTNGPFVVANWDGDGPDDLVYTPAGLGNVEIYIDGYDRSGGRCGQTIRSHSPAQNGVAVGDLNGDSKADIAVSGTTVVLQPSGAHVAHRIVTLAPAKQRSENLYLSAAHMSEHSVCDERARIERFRRGRWRLESVRNMGGTYDARVRKKPGAFRAVLPGSGPENPYRIICPRTVSPPVGTPAELDKAGCPHLASKSADELPWPGGDIEHGDFNGDGRVDVAVAEADQGQETKAEVVVFYGDDDGRLGTPSSHAVEESATSPTSVEAGDFNGDGAHDLAIQSSRRLMVLFQEQGGLGEPRVLHEGPHHGLFSGDLNGDGVEDLMAEDFQSGVSAWYGPALDKREESVAPPATLGDFVGDINDDGRPDILGRSIMYQVADRAFAASERPIRSAGPPTGSTAGDVSGDGRPDLISLWDVVGNHYQHDPGAIGVTRALGDHGFAPMEVYSVRVPRVAKVGDIAGDERADVVIAGNGQVSVLTGGRNGLGTVCGLLARPHQTGGVGDVEIVSLPSGVAAIAATKSDRLLLLRVR